MEQKAVLTEQNVDKDLDLVLNRASSIITKDYLDRLAEFTIADPSKEERDVDVASCGRFYRLSKLVISKEENFLDKLATIVNVVSSINCSLATLVQSDGQKVDYYFGLISKEHRKKDETDVKYREAEAAAFKGALNGNLSGSDLGEGLRKEEVERLKASLCGAKQNYAAVSGIVAIRDEESKNMAAYVQGLENLVDSLKGQKYTIVMLADPVSTSRLQTIKEGYEMLHTQLATFARSSVTFNESDTLSLSKARSNSISNGISQGIALTQNHTTSKGKYFGGSVSAGISFVVSANVGIHGGMNSGTADTRGRTTVNSTISQRSQAETSTTASAKTAGKSLQLTYENRSIKTLLDKIDQHLQRLDDCESFGAFNCAAYVVADDRETALTVASNYNALMRGQNSCLQASHINIWSEPDDAQKIGKYIQAFSHPRFSPAKNADFTVTPASIISGNELAIQIGLPKKSVPGITVIPMASFGRNIVEMNSRDTITLGTLYHMGHDEKEQEVRLDLESLAMHTFITGSTGKGKSTVIYSILDQLMTHPVKGAGKNIKFMVIEPAKGEYKERFGSCKDVHVYGTNAHKMPLLKLNPFSFPEDVHVLEHIDRLVEIFNVCWPMYAAMPAVLKDAIERAYQVAGWDMEMSICRYQDSQGRPLYPSFMDVLQQIHKVMDESAYSADSRGDYTGALCTRLKSLTNGLYGQIFSNEEISGKELFDENVIIDLSRTGSTETKSLIMGLLVMKLQEYRMAEAKGGNAPLQHVTVLEEAHHLLKRTSTEQRSEGANLLGKAVEMLANSIAEMRTYGEGFIIADQAPGLMDLSVIRNTNTKIILGLPDFEDRELVGRAAGLNEEQILEVSRLQTFVAAVYQNNWLEPVLCDVRPREFKQLSGYHYRPSATKRIDSRMKYLEYLLLPIQKWHELQPDDVERLIDGVYTLPIPAEAKVAFIRYTKADTKEEAQKLRGQVVYSLFNAATAFDMARDKQQDIDSWYATMKELLHPSITQLSELDQQKIIALLTREQALLEEKGETNALYNHLMDHLERSVMK